jgi:hypothetical protein
MNAPAKEAERVGVLSLAVAVLALVGCAPDQQTDQCMRRVVFKECMAALPAGPLSTKYNDWDEVVQQCDTTAAYQSKRPRRFIAPQCRDYE